MRKAPLVVMLLGTIIGCVNSPIHKDTSRIPFNEVTQVQLGVTTADQILEKFGKPERIVPYSDDHDRGDIWEYSHFNFFIQPESQRVLTLTSYILESDPIHRLPNALRHFRGKSFKARDVGWIAKHHYSDDAVYVSDDRSVSMQVRKSDSTVFLVSLSAPRPPSIITKSE